jgi:hypothetical protein
MTPSSRDCCHQSVHVLPLCHKTDSKNSADFLQHLDRCEECQSLREDFDVLAKALNWLEVPDPSPSRWTNLRSDVLSKIALEESTAACPDFEAQIVADSSEECIDTELEDHLKACDNCSNSLHEVQVVKQLLDMAPVPEPDPKRWRGLKSRVLEAVHPAPRPLIFPTLLLKVAAAVLLMFTGALLASMWPSRAPSLLLLNQLHSKANRAFDKQDWSDAEKLLQTIVQEGSQSQEGHPVVAQSLSELEALRRFMDLPHGARARKQGLARFIYQFPYSRLTGKAIAEYTHLQSIRKKAQKRAGPRKGIERIDPMPQPDPEMALAFYDNIKAIKDPRGYQAILIKSNVEPWLRNAAYVQLALHEMSNNNPKAARKELELISGQSPASRFAEEQLEILEEE